ncbi:MAG: chemotaxis response regulator protein-glutamate methylesterase [Deltaproteobacteria bacterium]|nr:chemotaxis response regulator protein-glutamate methylesterase [Deltaproteobacteria bacterium]
MQKIRVLIIDDSAFMRRAIKQMVETDQDIEVVGVARDGIEGVDMALSLTPDVVTMDIEMPRMNGLEAIEHIMDRSPRPILVVSSLTTEGAKATFEALDKGAADYISKNLTNSAFDMMKIQTELIGKLKALSRKRNALFGIGAARRPASVKTAPLPPAPQSRRIFATQKIAFVAIGASTGGPKAIQEVLMNLPGELTTPFLIAIHMPKAFTWAFAERLNDFSKIPVREAQNGEPVKSSQILLTPGGMQTRIRRKGLSDFYIEINDNPANSVYKPSVDIAMLSVAECYPGRSMGVVLTGMGHDGLEGVRAIRQKGGKSIAQSEETCTVYGMPKAIVDAGLADKVVALDRIAGEIINMI